MSRKLNWQRAWQRRVFKLKQKMGYRSRNKGKFYRNIALLAFLSVFAAFFLVLLVFAWYAKDLPRPDKVVRREGFATRIYDRNGVVLYDVFADQRRTPIEIAEVPEYLRQATVAIEDKHFWEHQGFDPTGWARAVYNIIFRRRLQGGSTLTQQLVKNVLLTPERTMGRKIKEFIMAVQIEKKYSKSEILQMYLNEAPYGGTAWGVAVGAETYFGKEVSQLNLIESAFLAGLPQAPSRYSPYSANADAYIGRTEGVLRRMREDGYISVEEEEQAVEQLAELEFEPVGGKFKAPHFVMYVKALLEEKYGETLVEQGGLQVYTTLDWELQQATQEIVAEEIADVAESLHITNGALTAMDPQTGEILAMVGSRDYNDENYDGKVNVTTRLRQPGSAIKPVNYLTALRKGYTPASVVVDAETEFPGGSGQPAYVPKNYDGKTHGPVQLRYALGSSLNIPAVKTLAKVGVQSMLEVAYDMGFSSLEPTQSNVSRFGLSLTLGGGEIRLVDMVSAYSAFANEGYRVDPVAVLKVEDSNGKTLEENQPKLGKPVLSKEEAWLISNILSDNSARLLTFGANSLLNISGRSVAVKTGTTNDMRDNWAVGWTPDLIVGVWVGNNDNSAMKRVASGISGASPIWRRAMLEGLKTRSVKEFVMPEGIVSLEVDSISGYPVHDGWPGRTEYFIKGTEPTGDDPIHSRLKLCRGQNKLATNTQVAKGEYEEKEFIVLKEEDPFSTENNRWQAGIDAWISQQGDERYHYPREYCEASEELVVYFNQPEDRAQVANEFEVEIKAVSSEEIREVKLYVDDEEKASFTEKPFQTTLVLSDGPHQLKAKAWDKDNRSGETTRPIGVNVPWDWAPSPTPTPTIKLTLTPIPTPTLVPTLTPAMP